MTNFQVIHGGILDVDAEVIVNAADSYGMMGGGVAGGPVPNYVPYTTCYKPFA